MSKHYLRQVFFGPYLSYLFTLCVIKFILISYNTYLTFILVFMMRTQLAVQRMNPSIPKSNFSKLVSVNPILIVIVVPYRKKIYTDYN